MSLTEFDRAQFRMWCLENAHKCNRLNPTPDKIIRDARKISDFVLDVKREQVKLEVKK